jgi:hypothetical protein
MSKSDHIDNDSNYRTASLASRYFGNATTSSSSSSVSKMEFHLALAVLNIKKYIPIILEMEKDQYDSWVELFCIHTRSHHIVHIVSCMDKKPPTNISSAKYEH